MFCKSLMKRLSPVESFWKLGIKLKSYVEHLPRNLNKFNSEINDQVYSSF